MQQGQADILRKFMERAQLSQLQLSEQIGVSQSTISRALSGSPERRGKARDKLFNYVRAEMARDQHDAPGMKAVIRAFESIWDGSEVHASAVARVIDAMDGLAPKKD